MENADEELADLLDALVRNISARATDDEVRSAWALSVSYLHEHLEAHWRAITGHGLGEDSGGLSEGGDDPSF